MDSYTDALLFDSLRLAKSSKAIRAPSTMISCST